MREGWWGGGVGEGCKGFAALADPHVLSRNCAHLAPWQVLRASRPPRGTYTCGNRLTCALLDSCTRQPLMEQFNGLSQGPMGTLLLGVIVDRSLIKTEA